MSDGIVLQPALNEALGPALIGTIAALALVMSIIDAASIYAHAQSQIIRFELCSGDLLRCSVSQGQITSERLGVPQLFHLFTISGSLMMLLLGSYSMVRLSSPLLHIKVLMPSRLLDTAAAVVDAMVRHTIELNCVRQVTRSQIVWHYTIKTKTDIITFIDVFR